MLLVEVHLRVDGGIFMFLEDCCRWPFGILNPTSTIFFGFGSYVDVGCSIINPLTKRLAIQVELACAYSVGHLNARWESCLDGCDVQMISDDCWEIFILSCLYTKFWECLFVRVIIGVTVLGRNPLHNPLFIYKVLRVFVCSCNNRCNCPG